MSDKTVKITDENFDELVINSEKLVIVDFWAEWCGPCKAIAPILDKICDQFGDKILVGKVNVDEVKQTPVKYGIRSIPTLLFFHKGEIVKQEVGLQSEQALIDSVNQIVS
jgi:thioredoxin 1